MTIADQARDNAVPCEMVLYAYRKNKDGIVVSFVMHPDDMPTELATAPIGARWVAALVRVGDDELPIPPTAKGIKTFTAKNSPAAPRQLDKPAGAKPDKRDWRDMLPSTQAALHGNKAAFWAFLNETRGYEVTTSDEAAEAVREVCGVNSRKLLDYTDAGKTWHSLDVEFKAWELVGA